MHKKIICLVLTVIMLSTLFTVYSNADSGRVIVEVNSLDLEGYQDRWENESELHFRSEGLNISIYNKITKVIMVFEETMGRDIELVFKVPAHYIEPSVLSNIKTVGENTTVVWQTSNNITTVSFYLDAYQSATLEISKLSLTLGRTRKKVQDFWGYTEYNSYTNGSQTDIVTYINKQSSEFEMDNKHIIVQYKTDFFGWYYPVSDTSSDEIYYYMDDMGDKYRLVTHFNTNESGHVKIHAYRGASDGFLNYDTMRGAISNWWLKTTIGAKKIIMDWFGDPKPSVE